MKHTMTEAKVLNKLGIPNFRHMTKDKVVSFVSMLPQMDPDVAKRALEQFPNFAETGLAVVKCLKDTLETVISSNTESMTAYYAVCQEALASLEAELKREDLTDEGRKLVIDGIMSILSAMSQKDSENKQFLHSIFRGAVGFGMFLLVCLAAALGIRMNTSRND